MKLQFATYLNVNEFEKHGYLFSDFTKNTIIKEFLKCIDKITKEPLINSGLAESHRKEHLLNLYQKKLNRKSNILKNLSFFKKDNYFVFNLNISNMLNHEFENNFWLKENLTALEEEAKDIILDIEYISEKLVFTFHEIGVNNSLKNVIDIEQEKLNYATMMFKKVVYNGCLLEAINSHLTNKDTK